MWIEMDVSTRMWVVSHIRCLLQVLLRYSTDGITTSSGHDIFFPIIQIFLYK